MARKKKKTNLLSIKDANIKVSTLPTNLNPPHYENGNIPLYCVTINGEILKTPRGNLIYHENERGIRELAAELEYMDELRIESISIYSLCCTQVDLYNNENNSLSRETIEWGLLNDSVLRSCAGPEIVDQMKYLKIVQDFLNAHQIQYPHFPQIPLEDRENLWGGNFGFETSSEENFIKLVDFIEKEVNAVSPSAT